MPNFRKLPPLNELAAFEAIARHRSFTKASKELFLTPSAVSQRLRQLEAHLATQLVLRTRTKVELTAEGGRYLEVVRDALSKLAVASESFSAATAQRRVKIGVMPALAGHWLISRLRLFHRLFPDIDLDVQSAIAMANVEAGEVDVALRWGKGGWPGLEQVKLFPDAVQPVCSKAYLADASPLVAPADLAHAVLLRNAMLPWKPWFEHAGLDWPEPARGPSFNDSTLAMQAAVDSQGVALGRRLLVRELVERGDLIELFDVIAPIEEAFFVVYRKDSLDKPEVAAFVEWITSVAHDEQAAPN